MSKYKIVGIVNLVLCGLFISLLSPTTFEKEAFSSIGSFIDFYFVTVLQILFVCMNAFVGYTLLSKKKHPLPDYLYILLTFSTCFWFILLLFGYFFATNILFPFVSLAFSILIFYLLKKSSKNIAIFLAITTFFIAIFSMIVSFEETYCWQKGAEADTTGSSMVTATKDDESALKGYSVKEGEPVGVSFKTHMICHQTFNFGEALKEKYSL